MNTTHYLSHLYYEEYAQEHSQAYAYTNEMFKYVIQSQHEFISE